MVVACEIIDKALKGTFCDDVDLLTLKFFVVALGTK